MSVECSKGEGFYDTMSHELDNRRSEKTRPE